MSLSLAYYNNKKVQRDKKTFFDKRVFKGGRKREDILLDELRKEITDMGIKFNKEIIVKDLILLKDKLRHLNFFLLINVYLYFREKNYDLGIIFENFDKDFESLYLKIIQNNPYVADMKDPLVKHKYRQDFIIYMFLLEELDLLENSRELGDVLLEEENDLLAIEDYKESTEESNRQDEDDFLEYYF